MKTKVALQGALGVGLSVCAALLLSACGGKVNMAEFNEAFYQGDKENALKIAKGGKGVLWDYQSGVNAFWLGESKEAAKLLKSADESIEKAWVILSMILCKNLMSSDWQHLSREICGMRKSIKFHGQVLEAEGV